MPGKYFPKLEGISAAEAVSQVDRLIRDLMMQGSAKFHLYCFCITGTSSDCKTLLFSGYTKLSDAAPPLCISKDEDGMTFESTELGRVMAKYPSFYSK